MIRKAFNKALITITGMASISCGGICSSRIDYKLDEVLKDYFLPHTRGSYWVYQNQESAKDSIFVTKSEFQILDANCNTEETLRYTLKSSARKLITTDSACFELNHYGFYTNECNTYGFFSRIYSGISPEDSIFIRDAESLTINSVNLNNKFYTGEIVEFITEQDDHLYLQKGIGVIGWISKQDTFNLINHHIAPL